jgi:hypothetical protein
VTWYSHESAEGSAGLRALYSYSKDFETWSEPAVLLDSIGEMGFKGVTGTAMWPVFNEINGRLYVTASVTELFNWSKNGRHWVPERRDLPRIVKRIYSDGHAAPRRYWLSESIPTGYEEMDLRPYTEEPDEDMRNDMAGLISFYEEKGVRYAIPETADEGTWFCEPAYFMRPDGTEVGVYREDRKKDLRLYASVRDKETGRWLPAKQTNIPDSPSKTAAGNLPDGRAYVIGNFLDKLWLRDPLIIAFSKDGIHFDEAYTLRCGAAMMREKRSGDGKGPGFQYPDAIVAGDNLWVAYSDGKERIAITRIPISDNLLENGGFELGDDSPAKGWKARVSGSTTAAYLTEQSAETARSGMRAVSISNPVGKVERWYVINSSSPAVDAGRTYRFSAWIRAENMDLANAYIQIDWLDSSDQLLDSILSDRITKDQDWTEVAVEATAPEGAVKLRPLLMVEATGTGSTAVVTVDDCGIFPQP